MGKREVVEQQEVRVIDKEENFNFMGYVYTPPKIDKAQLFKEVSRNTLGTSGVNFFEG